MIRLGVKKSDAEHIAHDIPRRYEPGTDWELEIKADGSYNLLYVPEVKAVA